MNSKNFVSFLAAVVLLPLASPGQVVISGSQNALLKVVSPPRIAPSKLTTTLGTAGYNFVLVTSGFNGSVSVVVDPTGPVVVPLTTTATHPAVSSAPFIPASPGFWATFSVANNTPADITFTFPFQYWADNKIIFELFDSNDVIVWQSEPIAVDPPPLSQPVDLLLKSKSSWSMSVFVPLSLNGTTLADGQYRLEATITGTPVFSANASFQVENLLSGPIIGPEPLVPPVK